MRTDKENPPRPGMVWSEKLGMWLDADTRSPERRAQDERTVRETDRDSKRVQAAIAAAGATRDPGNAAMEGSAYALAKSLMEALIQAREKQYLSQSEVARRMGVPQPAIVRLEAGTHSPTLTTISRYAAAVGVTLAVSAPRRRRRRRLTTPRARRMRLGKPRSTPR